MGFTMIVEDGLSSSQEYRMLQAAVTETRMAMAITDPNQPDNPIVLTNDAFLSMTGYPADEVIGRNCRFLQGPNTEPEAVEAIREGLRHHREVSIELTNYRRDGSPFLNQLLIRPIFDEQGHLVHFFASQVDLTPQRQAEAQTRATEERLRLVADELSHRVKNTLSTVQSIVRQTLRHAPSLAEAGDIISARLVALGQAHEALTRQNWENSELGSVIRGTIQPHSDVQGRFRISGPEVHLEAKSSLAVAMAVHELCTNAIKYGALSVTGGTVLVGWTIEASEGSEYLHLEWRELEGPPVVSPDHKGFGSILIKEALAADLGGKVELLYEPAGLVCRIEAKLSRDPAGAVFF
jgi:PAS domain S-box-containing protein